MAEEPLPRETWTWQEGINYEVTREIIGQVIGVCSGKIGEQERSAHPDQEIIDAWDRELGEWAERQHYLRADPESVAAASEAAIARLKYLRPRKTP